MEEQKDFLLDLEFDASRERVRWGIRLGDYLIDAVIIRLIIYFITRLIIAFDSEGYYDFFAGFNRLEIYLVNYLYGAVIILLYYTILEGGTKGRTLGKVIMGTQAVMNDGSAVTWNAALLRSLSRLVPFEPFSAFNGNPWHDSWTGTQVVKARKQM